MTLLLWFSQDPPMCIYMCSFIVGVAEEQLARLVRLQNGNLEENPPVFCISHISASMGRPASSLAAGRPPERIHWAKTLLVLGEDKRDEVFRKMLCICNWMFVWKETPCPVTLHVYLWGWGGGGGTISKKEKKEVKKERTKGRMTEWMTLKTEQTLQLHF